MKTTLPLLLLLFLAGPLPAQTFRLTEFLASNAGGLRDEDGDSSDWMEVQNVSGGTVSLLNWCLTDDADDLVKWRFPATNLAAGQFLVVFASGKNRAVAGAPLHTSFSLSAAGEYVALVEPNGVTIASQYLPQAQDENVSYGRRVNGAEHFFSPPSPGATNLDAYLALVATPQFSPGRGFYDSTSFNVTITCGTAAATLRYTANGGLPASPSGLTYTGPIPSNEGRVLRAQGTRFGYEPSVVATHSYVFLDRVLLQSTNDTPVSFGSAADYTLGTNITLGALYGPGFKSNLLSVPTLSLALPEADVFGINGVWSNPQGTGVQWERLCSAEFLRPDGQPGFAVDCGLRLTGGASRTVIPKHGLRLLFKSVYGPARLDYPLFAGSTVEEFDTLSLHHSFGDHWLFSSDSATMQRDQWMRDTQNALGGYGPHGTYVHLYLNGLYWGLYNVGEKGDAAFAASYLGGEKEEYDAFNDVELVDGTTNAMYALLGVARSGLTNDLAYTNYSALLQVTNFIDYLLMNFYAANVDWPVHNWNAARRRPDGPGFYFFSWDAETSLGLFSALATDATGVGWDDGAWLGGLYAGGRGHAEFRRLFGDRAQRALFADGALTVVPARRRWDERTSEARDPIVGEAARWGRGFTPEDWRTGNEAARTWFPQRGGILLGQLRRAGLFPALDAPAISQRGGLAAPGTVIGLTNLNPGGALYFTTNGLDPRQWGGALEPTAQVWSALTLSNASTNRLRVQARVLDGADWSALTDADFYVQELSGLGLGEIMYKSPDFGTNDGDEVEFLEVQNSGGTPIDLSHVQFTQGVEFSFTNGTRLEPGAVFLLVRNTNVFAQKYPGTNWQGVYEGRLNNDGEALALRHAAGSNLVAVAYGVAPPWPIIGDGDNFSLVPWLGDPARAESWQASRLIGGSPSAPDLGFTLAPIVISEILASPGPMDLKTLEFYNPTATNFDLGGWIITDNLAIDKLSVPGGTIVPAHGFAILDEGFLGSDPEDPFSAVPNPRGGAFYLAWDLDGFNQTHYLHALHYGPSSNTVSFARYVLSTGEERWAASSATTLGATNASPLSPPVILNEFMVQAGPAEDQFLELHNRSGATVNLDDGTNPWKLIAAPTASGARAARPLSPAFSYVFSNGLSMAAGQFLLVVPIDPETFRTKYSVAGGVPIVGPFFGRFAETGMVLSLQQPGPTAPDYLVVDEVQYGKPPAWPDDEQISSWQRRRADDFGQEPTNWFRSALTPGAASATNVPPVCAQTNPLAGAVFPQGQSISLAASASDSDGSVSGVGFYDGTALLFEDTSAPYSFNWSGAAIGAHQLTVLARDNRRAVTRSAVVSITVDPPGAGGGGGLRADYFDGPDFTGARLRRTETTIDFDWGAGAPDGSMGADAFSVRWQGRVLPRFTGTYTFHAAVDGGVRLWINNQLLVDSWFDQTVERSGFIALAAGFFATLKMEYFENAGHARAALAWSAPSVPQAIVPAAQLYPYVEIAPTVSLTNLAGTFLAATNFTLGAAPADADGFVTNVNFLTNAVLLGGVAAAPWNFTWTNPPAGAFALTAVAADESGLLKTSAVVNVTLASGAISNDTMIATGAVWKYFATGAAPSGAWKTTNYDDTAWSSGPAQLGYGDGDEATVVGYGGNAASKYITTYFRRAFTASAVSNVTALRLRVLRDDGVAVYLNGLELWRSNLPTNALAYSTLARTGVEDSSFHTSWFTGAGLANGTNVLAAELHQSSSAGPDAGFDLELLAGRTLFAP